MKQRLPPEMIEMFSAYMDPADVAAAELTDAPPRRAPTTKMTMYVSYIPALRSFSAHREGMNEVRASSVGDLLAELARLWPAVEFTLHFSRVAKAEISRRKNGGGPMAAGWY